MPAHVVGPNGIVYAEDVQPQMIDAIMRRVASEGLMNVRTVLGTDTDPRLPPGLHAVLMVDTYPQLPDPVALLRRVASALAPNGRLASWISRSMAPEGLARSLEDRMSLDVIKGHAAAAGLTLLSHETFLDTCPADLRKYAYRRREAALGASVRSPCLRVN